MPQRWDAPSRHRNVSRRLVFPFPWRLLPACGAEPGCGAAATQTGCAWHTAGLPLPSVCSRHPVYGLSGLLRTSRAAHGCLAVRRRDVAATSGTSRRPHQRSGARLAALPRPVWRQTPALYKECRVPHPEAIAFLNRLSRQIKRRHPSPLPRRPDASLYAKI